MGQSGEAERSRTPTADRRTPDTRDTDPASARYAAMIAALLDVRPAPASARFDAELDAAVAAQRIDPATARTLRWWQRTSVREAETYAATALPGVLATTGQADAVAERDCAEAAISWQQARDLAGLCSEAEPAHIQPEPVEAAPVEAAPEAAPAETTTEPVTELQLHLQPTVRHPAEHGVHDIAAVRAALRACEAPHIDLVDLTTTTVLTPAPVHRLTRSSSERKDRSHAHTATSA